MLNYDYLRFLQDDIDKMVSKLEERIQNLEEGSCMDALVLPLHGSLPPELQASSKAFCSYPPTPNFAIILQYKYIPLQPFTFNFLFLSSVKHLSCSAAFLILHTSHLG
jgi:hypothetical protein